jgi:hypothetical protein
MYLISTKNVSMDSSSLWIYKDVYVYILICICIYIYLPCMYIHIEKHACKYFHKIEYINLTSYQNAPGIPSSSSMLLPLIHSHIPHTHILYMCHKRVRILCIYTYVLTRIKKLNAQYDDVMMFTSNKLQRERCYKIYGPNTWIM